MTDTIVTTVLLLAAVTAWVVWGRMVARDLRQIAEQRRIDSYVLSAALGIEES